MSTACLILGIASLVFANTWIGPIAGIGALGLWFAVNRGAKNQRERQWARVGLVGAIFGLGSFLMNVIMLLFMPK